MRNIPSLKEKPCSLQFLLSQSQSLLSLESTIRSLWYRNTEHYFLCIGMSKKQSHLLCFLSDGRYGYIVRERIIVLNEKPHHQQKELSWTSSRLFSRPSFGVQSPLSLFSLSRLSSSSADCSSQDNPYNDKPLITRLLIYPMVKVYAIVPPLRLDMVFIFLSRTIHFL